MRLRRKTRMARTIGMEKEESVERRTKLNEKTNLLEMENYHYEVQEIPAPNLLREFFAYTEIPKIGFNFRTSPYGMPDEIVITDSTFRDGQQSREPYTVKQIRLHLTCGKTSLYCLSASVDFRLRPKAFYCISFFSYYSQKAVSAYLNLF